MALTFAMVVFATAVPVALSFGLAMAQARTNLANRALFYAADILRRVDITGVQDAQAFDELGRIPGIDNCSAETVAALQRVEVSSPYVKLVGIMHGNQLTCSSFGPHNPAIDLGPPDDVSPLTGHNVRENVILPFSPSEKFVVIDNGHVAAVLHKTLQVDAPTSDTGVALVTLSASRKKIYATRGVVDPHWLTAMLDLAPGQTNARLIGHNMVAMARSKVVDVVTIAALNEQSYSAIVTKLLAVLLPIGLISGLILSYLILRIARLQMSLPAAIKSALRNNEFFLVYQPIVRLDNHRWIGAEALLRWRRQDGSIMRPDRFIAAAEEAGLIGCITERVIKLIEPLLADLSEVHGDFYLSINLAPEDLHSDATLPLLKGVIERTGAVPPQLHVEITERGFADTAVARAMIDRMRDIGMKVAIDDFGTGYSSLSELMNFALDAIKIDKAFTQAVESHAVTNKIASLIVELGRELSLDIVAEGIETTEQAEILSAWKVGYGQGWLFSRDLSEDELREALLIPKLYSDSRRID
ncbi:EAL domain-containing protein [Dyella sp. C9]|uniref:EAL domain-containing protein n=1 Tax=Dyella sp. C9 TaxID=2202154 RepID=UPI000DEF81CC|nr:EAL domain-containing protein [Dyella sp. C9]